MPLRFVPVTAFVLAALVAGGATLFPGDAAGASLERPTYTAGDRWIYIFQGSLGALPGFNATGGGPELGLSGIAEVDVLGPAQARVGGMIVPGVRVDSHASGFLNGTFSAPGNVSVRASGTFSSDSSEVWETEDGLATLSNSSTSYTVSVTLGINFSGRADLWLNATTSYTDLPNFNLSVGETAAAPFTADLSAATSASFFGFATHNETHGSLTGAWTRQVLASEEVAVEAGTFSAFRLNQTMDGFPGLGTLAPLNRANETAWFSNDVGYYVKRQTFVNGSLIGEMRLKSYTYPAATSGPFWIGLALLIGIPIAAAAVFAFLLVRRRRRRTGAGTSGSAGPVGELPPKPPRSGP